MNEYQRAAKKARYEALCAKNDAGETLTQLELNESVQLLYELNPNDQYWRAQEPHLTPEDLWHARANGSTVAG